MIGLILPSILLYLIKADCPLNPYPRQIFTGQVSALLSNNFATGTQQYIYSLEEKLLESSVKVAIGVSGLQFNAQQKVEFTIDYVKSQKLNELKFNIQVNNTQMNWKSIKFNFFASLSPQFQVNTETVLANQLSKSLEPGKYFFYRPIPNFNNSQNDAVVRVFISGLQLLASTLDEEYYNMVNYFKNIKMFYDSSPLLNFMSQSIQVKKSIKFRISQFKLVSQHLSLTLLSNDTIKYFKFTYLVFNRRKLQQKDSYIAGDFAITGENQYKFSSLRNMGMLMVGMTGFKLPRDQLYNFNLISESYYGQTYQTMKTNFNYLPLNFIYIAFERQQKYVCQDCLNSANIFENKFCVQACPRTFSKIQRLGNFYCEKCDIEKLKVVDSNSGQCVCAKRHFLDTNEDSCKPCRYDCMTCSESNKCLTCDNGLLQTKRKLNPAGRCQCPLTGFYDNKNSEDIICQKCDPKCLTCKGPRPHDCTSCISGKQLDPYGFCTCKNNFVEDLQGNCNCYPPRTIFKDVCYDDFKNNLKCTENQTQQTVNMTRRCVCKLGFLQIGNNCIRCEQNSIFDMNQLKCKCVNETVYINGQCVPCRQNEEYDDKLQICACKPGTYKADNQTCITCPSRMTYLNGNCQCIFNYFESKPGVCEKCLRQTDGPKCRRNGY